MKDYVIVFGAAVRPNGKPSATLRQRITIAAAWAHEHPGSIVMPTGAVGDSGPAEAEVIMKALIEAGIPATRIIPECEGRDTLESVRKCDALIRQRGDCGRVICCTSGYHQPRCALLLRLLGHTVVVPPVSSSRGRLRRRTYGRLFAKEIVALPYDALLLLAKRRLKPA